MNINKVLEVLNNGDYIELEEDHQSSDLCAYSDSSYTVTLKEGGMIKITQVFTVFKFYRIELFVPNKKESVQSWTFIKHFINSSLYNEVKTTFYELYHKVSMKKSEECSKYFPE